MDRNDKVIVFFTENIDEKCKAFKGFFNNKILYFKLPSKRIPEKGLHYQSCEQS
jgi:hypothetical protein